MSASGPTRRLAIPALFVALAFAILAGVGLGAVRVSPADILGAIGRTISGHRAGMGDAVIIDLRLPRVLLAALVGAALAGAGTLYQALFRNPLADPYILGISSGAGLGATIALIAGAGSAVARLVGVPAGAFVGAVATITLVVRLSSRRGRIDPTSLLLAGVAISYTLAALTSFLMVFFRQSMQQVVFWMMGGLQGASWTYVITLAVMVTLGTAVPALRLRELDVLLLGDERAAQLGVDVERSKRIVLAAASLLVAGAVAVSGLIGFVGLMTPHMARLILGPGHRRLLPASMLAGATVMVLADLVARIVLAPVEIPVGIVTALFGGPFFVWLLVRSESQR
ncbi:MAG: iron ABC transporter permease [Coriobacteriia bacterium]